jgi:hypothetical protein
MRSAVPAPLRLRLRLRLRRSLTAMVIRKNGLCDMWLAGSNRSWD